MADIELGVVLKADGTAFVRGVKKAKGEVGGLGKEGQAASKKMDRLSKSSGGATGKIKNLGRSGFDAAKGLLLVGGAVASIAAAATGVVTTTADLNHALAGVRAVSGATTEQMSALEAQARDLGATTSFSAAEAAGAQEFLAKAGFSLDQVMQSTNATLQLAAAGQLDLARAADISSNVLSAFGKDASELQNVVDIMAATASGANTSVEQLGLAMQYTAPIAKAMGVSIEETSAAIGVLSNAGLQGEKAGTGLRNIFIKLANPSDRLRELMGDLTLETDGLAPIMKRLAESGLSAGEAMEIFGAEAGPAFNVMRDGADDLKDMAEGLNDVDGAAKSMAEARLDDLYGDLKKLNSAISELALILGSSGINSNLRAFVQELTFLAQGIGDYFSVDTEAEKIAGEIDIVISKIERLEAVQRNAEAGGVTGFLTEIFAADDLDNIDGKLEELRGRLRRLLGELDNLSEEGSEAAGAIGETGDAAGDAAGKLDDAGDSAGDAGDSAGEAAEKFRDLNEVWGQMAVAELEAGAAAMKAIDKRIEGVIDATRTEQEQIDITRQRRIDAIEDAVRVERISAQEAADLKRRVDEDYWRDREQLERGHMIDLADLQEEIWLDTLRGVRSGFVDFFGDTIREGELSWEALWGSFKDLAIDAISQVAAALAVNGLLKLFNIDGGGISIDVGGGGGGGGNNVTSIATSAAAKKIGAKLMETEAGQAVSQFLGVGSKTGAEAFALGEQTGPIAGEALGTGVGATGTAAGMGVTTLGGANTISGLGGGISGASVTGGSAGAGLGGAGAGTSSAASAGGFSAMGAGVLALPAAYVLGGKFVMEEVFGVRSGGFSRLLNNAREDLQGARPAVAGGLGLQTTAGDKFGFAAGANAGFAQEFARDAGIVTAELEDGLVAFRDQSLPEMIKLLDDAQQAFEETKRAGVKAFADTGVAAEEIGVMLQDGVIDQVDKAALGIEGLGVAWEHPKTGVTELREITEGQFRQIARAINSGELRLQALQGQARLTGSELDVLGRIGVTAAQQLGGSAAAAARDLGRITSAANDAARAVGSIPSGPSSRSFGGGGAPVSSGNHPGLAVGTPFVPRDMLAQIHAREMVIDPQSSDALRKYGIRVQGGGADPETKALLRGILDELGNLRVHAVIDDGSRAALAAEIVEPITSGQRRVERGERNRRGSRWP